MKDWNSFLKALRRERELRVVGPLFSGQIAEFGESVVYVDGGAQFRPNDQGISVGDGDSFEGELDHKLPTDKDFSDLAFVLNSVPDNIEAIYLYGFLDGRRDHELFNLGEAHRLLLRSGAKKREVFFDDRILAFSSGQWQFSYSGIFSLFALETTRVRLMGDCKYKIPELGEVGMLSSIGLSNIADGEIKIEAEGPVFVFLGPMG